MANTAKDLLRERAGIWNQAKELLDKAEEENRDLHADEEESYSRMMGEMDALKKRADRLEMAQSMEEELRSPVQQNPALRSFGEDFVRTENPYETEAYRSAWAEYITTGNSEAVDSLRAVDPFTGFQIGVDNKGGMFVPTTIEAGLLNFIEEHNVMRQLATVRNSTDNRQINLTDQHVEVFWMEEGEQFKETEATFGSDFLNAYKLGALTKFTHESLQDMVGINAEAYIKEDFGEAIARLEEQAFIAGDGVKKPTGFTTVCDTGITAASATAFTADELMALQHCHKQNRRRKSVWLMSDEAALAIRRLKVDGGYYHWQPSLVAGQPDMLLGHKMYIGDGIDGVGTGKTPIWFGDFKQYRIQDRRGVFMQRLPELFATEGKIGLMVYRRVDGKMVDKSAIKGLKMA